MKILNGLELADFVKQRQLHQVRSFNQTTGKKLCLAIVRTGDSPVTDTYLRLKRSYGEDIEVEVVIYSPTSEQLLDKIRDLNNDNKVHGIIIQLPLKDQAQTDQAIELVDPNKDVDGLGKDSKFTPATALAIHWLINGYNIDLTNKKIAIVGKGRLVGAPLAKLWRQSGLNVTVCDRQTDLTNTLIQADVIVTATGTPGLITSSMVKEGAVLVDAGTASEQGRIVGDVAEAVRSRQDITMTPLKGGVGPLTISALFDNLLIAAKNQAVK